MPQVKSSKSLKDICINSILENQKTFCKRFTLGEQEDGVNALHSDKPAVNPFDDLPTKLLEELIRLLREKESSQKYKITPFLKLLITPCLRTLDLTMIKNGSDINDVLHLATIRSPNLETLLLDSSTFQYVGNFNFIPKFVKLRILDISFPEAGDDCFGLIGKHCPDLRGLNAKSCDVTDDGIRKLCVVGNSKLIHKLNLERCSKITTKGIQMALDNLPHLRVLRHESLLECLAEIAQTTIDNKICLPKYSLSTLYILRETAYKIGSLQQSVLLCPNVTEVYLEMGMKRDGFNDTDLLSLLTLDKLYTMEITHAALELHGEELPIVKDLAFDGVVPLLKKFGYCLKRILIKGSFVVDIPVFNEFCPNLESLTLYHCEATQITDVKRSRLQNLKRLTLFQYGIFSSENLFLLLSSPSLSYVSITQCNALTDHVLQGAEKMHGFRNLEYLHLFDCDSITKNGIDIFLKESNPLKKITLGYHPPPSRITSEDIIDWNDNAIWIKKNWQFIFVFWRPFYSIKLGGHIFPNMLQI